MKPLLSLSAGAALILALGAAQLGMLRPQAGAPQAPAPAAKLHWAPPTLDKPITIEIGQGFTSKNLKSDRDYIIKLPPKNRSAASL